MNQKGFTLIELLVVIAIIFILSAIVISAISKAKSNSELKETTTGCYILNDKKICSQ